MKKQENKVIVVKEKKRMSPEEKRALIMTIGMTVVTSLIGGACTAAGTMAVTALVNKGKNKN